MHKAIFATRSERQHQTEQDYHIELTCNSDSKSNVNVSSSSAMMTPESISTIGNSCAAQNTGIIWNNSLSNKFGRLAQGLPNAELLEPTPSSSFAKTLYLKIDSKTLHMQVLAVT